MCVVRWIKILIRVVLTTIFPFLEADILKKAGEKERRLEGALRSLLADTNVAVVYAYDETDGERIMKRVRNDLALSMLATFVRIDRIPGYEGSLELRHQRADVAGRKGFKTIYLELFRRSYGDLKKILDEMDEKQLTWFLGFIEAKRDGQEYRLLAESRGNKTSHS